MSEVSKTTAFSTEELRTLADSTLQVFWPVKALHWCADEIDRLREDVRLLEEQIRIEQQAAANNRSYDQRDAYFEGRRHERNGL